MCSAPTLVAETAAEFVSGSQAGAAGALEMQAALDLAELRASMGDPCCSLMQVSSQLGEILAWRDLSLETS